MLPRSFFFDLDGTLTDSSTGIVRCLQFAIQGLGGPASSPSELRARIGAPLTDMLADLLQCDDPDRVARAVELYRDRYRRVGIFENELYGGVRQMLADVRGLDCDLFVVTAKPTVFAEQIIAHFQLGEFFAMIYGSELDGTRSQKHDLIAHVLRAARLDPADCVMIGDRHHDVDGAQQHRIRSVAALWGYGSRAELLACQPDLLVESPAELVGALAAWGCREGEAPAEP